MIHDLVLELTSPLILGGAEARELDNPITLRPPSLRGQLRFWSRALGGRELEERLWGSTDTGQRVRILGAHPVTTQPGWAYLFPENREHPSPTAMLPPGERFRVRFAIPDPELAPLLQAVVWTWLHLGGIGRRSRRGYGAFEWEVRNGDLLEGFLDKGFDRARDLAGPEALSQYLRTGLERAFEQLDLAVAPSRPNRASGAPEVLQSLDQVFVGRELWEAPVGRHVKDYRYRWFVVSGQPVVPPDPVKASLEGLLHGLNMDHRGLAPECLQLGQPSKPRIPSPMMWRLHKCSQRGFIPVMIWSPVGYDGEPPRIRRSFAKPTFCDFLTQRLGFERSLAGFALVE